MNPGRNSCQKDEPSTGINRARQPRRASCSCGEEERRHCSSAQRHNASGGRARNQCTNIAWGRLRAGRLLLEAAVKDGCVASRDSHRRRLTATAAGSRARRHRRARARSTAADTACVETEPTAAPQTLWEISDSRVDASVPRTSCEIPRRHPSAPYSRRHASLQEYLCTCSTEQAKSDCRRMQNISLRRS